MVLNRRVWLGVLIERGREDHGQALGEVLADVLGDPVLAELDDDLVALAQMSLVVTSGHQGRILTAGAGVDDREHGQVRAHTLGQLVAHREPGDRTRLTVGVDELGSITVDEDLVLRRLSRPHTQTLDRGVGVGAGLGLGTEDVLVDLGRPGL